MNKAQRLKLYLYEDDDALAYEITAAFERKGYVVSRLFSEAELSNAAGIEQPCVIIMDRIFHNVDSLSVLHQIRSAKGARGARMIVISSLASTDERIKGLESGGDDYLGKPFAMGELIARVESLMRRLPNERETVLRVGSLIMDVIDRSITRGSRQIALSPREFSLLEYFMRHPDQVITRTMILESIWKYKGPIDTNIVDVHMGNLRRKVDAEGEPPLIGRHRGIGFVLSAAGS